MAAPPTSPDIVIAQHRGEADHFPGVEAALARRGLRTVWMSLESPSALVEHRARVVVVKDTQSPLALDALRRARAMGAATALLMDGIVERRNTLENPFAEPGFLRPAPVDVVLCAGEADRERLELLGNDAVATGLPRLVPAVGGLRAAPLPREEAVLVATARRPAFDTRERGGLVAALVRVKGELAGRGVRAIWRLTGGIEHEIGVKNCARPFGEALAEASCVLTTPSTVMIEAMMVGRPVGLIWPFGGEPWQEGLPVWRGGGEEQTGRVGSEISDSRFQIHAGRDRGLGGVIDGLLSPTPARRAEQVRVLGRLHRSEPAPAESVADALAELVARSRGAGPAGWGGGRGRLAKIPSATLIPARVARAAGRPRVVNCVACPGSPVGGVMSWAQRLARSFRDDPSLGYDVRTLVVGIDPDGPMGADFELDPDGLTSVCTLDPLADHAARLESLTAALRALGPSIVMPNYVDACFMAALRVRADGARTVVVAHTDEPYYRDLATAYDRWEAAVAVSSACAAWVGPMAAGAGGGEGRPWRTIAYGVPVAAAPREAGAEAVCEGGNGRGAPLRLAYIGRMTEVQKRIGDLLGLVDGLESRGVYYELHMVGDGPDLNGWVRALGERTLRHGSVKVHGRRPVAWVERFLRGGEPAAPGGVDVSVLVSGFEGASVTMLEAMGAGVVPCVTRVSSGVDDWVRDGENGIVVPIGDTEEMADRLAGLGADRARLGAMGRAAWETVRGELHPERVAGRYKEVFDLAMAQPPDARPTDAAVRPMDLWRWPKVWCDDPAGADRVCAAALDEAGYRRVALDRPGPGCDAVLVRAVGVPATAEQVEAWRARGLGVAVSPHLRPDVEPEERVRAAVLAAIQRVPAGGSGGGRARIAVYGAGKHSRRMPGLYNPVRWAVPGYPFVGFIDERPEWGELFGLPVVTPDRAIAELRPDAVLLSSDAFEGALWEGTAGFRAAGIEVVPVYGRYGEAPEVEAAPGTVTAGRADHGVRCA